MAKTTWRLDIVIKGADNTRDLFLHDPTRENKMQILNWFLVFYLDVDLSSLHEFTDFLRWTSNAQKNKTWWATLKNIHSVQRLDNKTVCVKWRTEPILKILGPLNQSIAVSGTFDTWQIEHSSWVYWPQAKIHPLRKAGKAKLQFFSLSH